MRADGLRLDKPLASGNRVLDYPLGVLLGVGQAGAEVFGLADFGNWLDRIYSCSFSAV